ncbi:hypothetical protein TorRG33x02_262690 [Trema orientale]|uniref:Uncharacterized protein n=1 Tax=Trema orientale TaxID=63057 RepID=A0A2P5D4E2_TREOI|nr:hypothetical protein TorRG33x02_262690 [Trema orientale]
MSKISDGAGQPRLNRGMLRGGAPSRTEGKRGRAVPDPADHHRRALPHLFRSIAFCPSLSPIGSFVPRLSLSHTQKLAQRSSLSLCLPRSHQDLSLLHSGGRGRPFSLSSPVSSPSEFSSSSKRGRGRPPGSSNWQLLASLGSCTLNQICRPPKK